MSVDKGKPAVAVSGVASLAGDEERMAKAVADARLAYLTIRRMTLLLFSFAMGLFALAAVSGIVFRTDMYPIIFGGGGIGSSYFSYLVGSKWDIQKAYSNMLQAEIILDYYYKTAHMVVPYTQPQATLPQRESALQKLSAAAKWAVESLEKFLEKKDKAEEPDKGKGKDGAPA